MTWIRTTNYEESSGRLRQLYDRLKGPDNNVDNIMVAHSLRPHTLEGHMTIYKHVLHHSGNSVPAWFLETIGVYTSMLNGCDYCVDHHTSGLRRLLNNDARAQSILEALGAPNPKRAFSPQQSLALEYSRKLTLSPASLTESDIRGMRAAGWDDGEILEINQTVAYFNYANRTVLGLGVDTAGDVLGLAPNNSADQDSWNHS